MGTERVSETAVRLVMTFNFGQKIRACGWTEGYDMGYASLAEATGVSAMRNIFAFMVDRCYCLGVGPILAEAVLYAYTQPATPGSPPIRRVSQSIPIPTIPKDGAAYNKALSNTSSTTPALNYWADFGPTVYYISLATDQANIPVYRRNCWIAGLPDVSDDTDSVTITDPATDIAVQAFLQDLANFSPPNGIQRNGAKNSISIGSKSRTQPIKPCTAWNLDVNTYTVPGHTFVQNQPVTALGMKTIPGGQCPKGTYRVGAPIDANTISLQASATSTKAIRTGGFRPSVYVFTTVKSATPLGFTKRNKGRPRGLSVGRRRTPLIKRA